MSLRLIYNGWSHPFKSVSTYLAGAMRKQLCNYTHIYNSTEALLAAIKRTEFVGDVRFVKIDIVDFDLRGSPEFLVSHAFSHVTDQELKQG